MPHELNKNASLKTQDEKGMLLMKKTYVWSLVILLCPILILAACTPVTGIPSGGDVNAPAKTDSPDNPSSPSAEATDTPAETLCAPVIHPDQVLSAEEASAILGLPVTIDEGSRDVDKENGISSLYYHYTLSEMTDVSALVQIEQDGLKPSEQLEEGLTARSSFDFQAHLLKNESDPVEDMGDAAFLMKMDGQLFMVYRGYYVVVAFTMDEYDSTKNAPFTMTLGRKILENIQRLLNA